jgi:hypothetical protein
MQIEAILEPEHIEGDEHKFSEIAYRRAKEVWHSNNQGISLRDFSKFIESERDENLRQANYYKSMSKFYNSNVALSRKIIAEAYTTLLKRIQHLNH